VHARGVAIMRVEPRAISQLARDRATVLVTGTNGKTTTTHMIRCALGGEVACNATGANMQSGVVTALADSTASRAVLEVDELHFPFIAQDIRPRVVVLLNATRDQLDRSHEVARVAAGWQRALERLGAVVVANAADPHVVAATPAERAIWCDPGTRWPDDARTCPRCGQLIDWSDDAWSCSCGFAMPEPDYRLDGGDLVDPSGRRHALRLSLPGRVNTGNAVMAAAAAASAGIDIDTAIERMSAIHEASGRFARYDIGGRPARLILAKNPAGTVAALDLVGDAPLIIGINARGVDGRDTSWLYDVPFESLAGRTIGVTGERRDDLALRLHLAGVTPLVDIDPHRLAVRMPDGDLCLLGNYSNFVAWRRGVRWPR
jgi:UDP-N-acetylmuramyl tripeptide synthase